MYLSVLIIGCRVLLKQRAVFTLEQLKLRKELELLLNLVLFKMKLTNLLWIL